ncbi:MBL fold metallo-hydrolase [Pseudonocardia kongjuensis]|uniref:MBL fold metallo-hydrolase n=1 Tax=Pseudonocardia kongjuensis TaxID=102227 RepID=A0ABN1XS43_9PSEU
MLKQIRTDLWQTRPYSPMPGMTTHAYLWTGAPDGNVLFYSTGTEDDFDDLDTLGGIAHQYLTHEDEAGTVLPRIAEHFGARLHAPARERDAIARFATPHELFEQRHVDERGVEVIPTPGHTPGSTSFLVPGAGGESYLFAGDTVHRPEDGDWTAGYIPGVSDADELVASLRLLGTFEPDLVIYAAGAHPVDAEGWAAGAETAVATVPGAFNRT